MSCPLYAFAIKLLFFTWNKERICCSLKMRKSILYLLLHNMFMNTAKKKKIISYNYFSLYLYVISYKWQIHFCLFWINFWKVKIVFRMHWTPNLSSQIVVNFSNTKNNGPHSFRIFFISLVLETIALIANTFAFKCISINKMQLNRE